MRTLKIYYQQHPLRSILLAALLIRLVAVVFSKGFGWIDDQFLIVEIAQSWVDGTDYYGWLPNADGSNVPKGFSFFYVGLHYLLFRLLEWIQILEPQSKMFVVRFLHALWSLLIVFFGYKITLKLGDRKTANLAGWLLALLWFFPFLSVRNLVEFVSIPFLIWGTYLVVQSSEKTKWITWLWVGILFGLAFNIRMQTLLFSGGIGLVLLIQQRWKSALVLALGFTCTVALLQGGIDFWVWGEPFAQLKAYVAFNMTHYGNFTTGPWYVYLLFLLGILIPPVSLFLFFGWLKSWKKLLLLFIPVLLFLLFHSYYPNKQERFVVTIIPFLLIAGVIGWQRIVLQHETNNIFIRLNKVSWVFFWTLNLILLLPVSMIYSKKARVESMVYLSQYDELKYFLIEDVNKNVLRFPPMFYLKKWVPYDALMANDNFGSLSKKNGWNQDSGQPGFVLFFQPDNIDQRVEKMKSLFPRLVFETKIEPGTADRVLHRLNPINDNQDIYIYRNEAVISKKTSK
ncbi:MAG: glycosyltransferase family 39 protein [Bacteroidales bacterium]|nr:glycosyltransferase family 39 protein [Bacteroidales bacterium]